MSFLMRISPGRRCSGGFERDGGLGGRPGTYAPHTAGVSGFAPVRKAKLEALTVRCCLPFCGALVAPAAAAYTGLPQHISAGILRKRALESGHQRLQYDRVRGKYRHPDRPEASRLG